MDTKHTKFNVKEVLDISVIYFLSSESVYKYTFCFVFSMQAETLGLSENSHSGILKKHLEFWNQF